MSTTKRRSRKALIVLAAIVGVGLSLHFLIRALSALHS